MQDVGQALNDGTAQMLLGVVFLVSGLAVMLLFPDSGPRKPRRRA